MKSLFVGLLVIGLASTGQGQSLDIGGVELHLGQSATSARSAMSAVYALEYQADGKWFVYSRLTPEEVKAESPTQLLGDFTIRNEKVSAVSKWFLISIEGDVPYLYSRALDELYKRGGKKCVTMPVKVESGKVPRVDTVCGQYVVKLIVPITVGRVTSYTGVVMELTPE